MCRQFDKPIPQHSAAQCSPTTTNSPQRAVGSSRANPIFQGRKIEPPWMDSRRGLWRMWRQFDKTIQYHSAAQYSPTTTSSQREMSVHPEQTLFFRDEKSSLHGWIYGEVCGGCAGSSISQSTAQHNAAQCSPSATNSPQRNVGSSRAKPIFQG